jgi:CSLREA domain-containing protein
MISKFPNMVFRLTMIAALFTMLTLTPTPAHAALFTLTANWDSFPGDGLCSLREAIIAANTDTAVDACPAGSGTDTIILPAGGYILTVAGFNENAALSGDLDITEDLIIAGAGSASTWISANLIDRVFHVIGTSAVEISGVTITLGESDRGGGILNHGTLTLTDVSFTDNNAFGGVGIGNTSGGGLYNLGAATLTNTTFGGNTAADGGGGFYNSNIATVTNSTFTDNSAALGGGIYNSGGGTMTLANSTITDNTVSNDGGGIVNEHALTITDGTISDNSASFAGGGIYNVSFASVSTLTVTNSTVSGNESNGDGGGIYNSETATFTNSTISGNSADSDAGGIFNSNTVNLHNATITNNSADTDADELGEGGGVFVTAVGTLTLGNTIIAGNFDNSTVIRHRDCSGTLNSLGYNLIQKINGCSLNGLNINLSRVQPLLGPLQDNGGTTWTHALLAGSPAIDAGDPAGCTDENNVILTADQRGYARPLDGNGDSIIACDIGAFE